MASQFETLFREIANPVLDEHLGESVTYTPDGGSATTITAIVGVGVEELSDSDDRSFTRIRRLFSIHDSATTGVLAPARGDVIAYDSVDYRVIDIDRNEQAGRYDLDCLSLTTVEVAGSQYRMRRV